jgi:glycosyltransferase involved in cell wall biosynthesis
LGLKKETVILTIHDIEFLKRTAGVKYLILKKLWIDWPIKKSAFITTISEFTKSELLKLEKYTTPIVVIPNPLTLPIIFESKKFNTRLPNILQIGTKKNKNLPRLIESLKDIPCQLSIIGKLTLEQKKLLQQANINYLEKYQLSEQEIINEYRNCDILAFVSTYEGFGLPIIEAQAMGRVVITSNTTSMPEVVRSSALMVDPYSSEAIKKGILSLINNEGLRNKLIQKGLINVTRFQPEEIARQYNNIYKKLN